MQIKAKVGGNTTSGEFRALAIFFDALAQNKASEFDNEPKVVGGAVAVAPTNEQASQAQPKVEAQQAQVQQTTRRRRTKAEIEADEAAKKKADEETEAKNQEDAISGEAAAIAAADTTTTTTAVGETVDTSTGEITTTPVEEFEKVANEPAVTNGKAYSEAEVQTLASVVARTKGAGIVKDKIAELGKARIAELDPNQLNLLGAFLEGQK